MLEQTFSLKYQSFNIDISLVPLMVKLKLQHHKQIIHQKVIYRKLILNCNDQPCSEHE